jgi:DNA-binding transcriptional MerR regulator
MTLPFTPPRQVSIDDAAVLVGTTPTAIRRYQEIGLLPELPSFGYDEVIRLLWIQRMSDAEIAVDAIDEAFADAVPGGAARRLGLLSDVVADRLRDLPEGALRQSDLDTLLVTEQIFGPLGAAVQASRFIAVATDPQLREESDRVDAAEEALDDSVAVDDPRVARVAAERYAFEAKLHAVIEGSGLARDDDALFDAWDVLYPVDAGRDGTLSALESVALMPYDFSPARLRCMELAGELDAAS